MASSITPNVAGLALVEASKLVHDGALTPIELLESALAEIAAKEPALKAFVTVCEESARVSAEVLTAEQAAGFLRGPLHGIPVAVKDLIDTAGIPTTCSSLVRANTVPDRDATVIQRIKDAGAIIIGKTNTHEFAYGVVTPPTNNAWSLEHIPGGSSGGSAVAVATSMCTAALGTDTAGSVRIPATFNGVVGLKPTYGRVPKSGVATLSWSLDHVGPLTRRVADAALLLRVMAGRASEDATSARESVEDYPAALDQSVRGLRLGIARTYFGQAIDPQVRVAVETAARHLSSLGATLVDVEIPEIDKSTAALLGIIRPEASSYHQRDLRDAADLYGPTVRPRLEMGEVYFATHYVNAQRARTLVKEGLKAAFTGGQLDALLVPTVPMTAPRHGQDTVTYPDVGDQLVMLSLIRYGAPFNLSGQPVLTLPCGFDDARLPIGLGIVGRPFEEARVLAIGHTYEQTTDWHECVPPVPSL